MHLHDRFEIMYLNSGALSLNFLGKEYIMKAGDCTNLPPTPCTAISLFPISTPITLLRFAALSGWESLPKPSAICAYLVPCNTGRKASLQRT